MRRWCFRTINARPPQDRARPTTELPAAENGIRPQPADNTRTRTYTPMKLRDAIAWREILNLPSRLPPESDLDS